MINIKAVIIFIFGLGILLGCSAITPDQNTQLIPSLTIENVQTVTPTIFLTPTPIYPQAETVKFVYGLFPKNNQRLMWEEFLNSKKDHKVEDYSVYVCGSIVFSSVAEYGDQLTNFELLSDRLEVFINKKPINQNDFFVFSLPLLTVVDQGESGELITTSATGDYCWNAEGFIIEGLNEVEIYFHKTSGAIAKQSWEFEIIGSEQ